MIGAILAAFTAAAMAGQEAPTLLKPFNTLEECQVFAATSSVQEEARNRGVVVLCLQVRTGV